MKSLVLVSQGIETGLEHTSEAGWGLTVSEEGYQSALEAIRHYHIENRGWPWQREIFHAGVIFDWASLAWVVLVLVFFWLDGRIGLRGAGLMNGQEGAQGEWWRLFTAVWLHADVSHLTFNATIGLVLLGLAMASFGSGAGLLAPYLAGVGGNLLAWLLSPSRPPSLGASGMVMGALGLLAIHSITRWQGTPQRTKYLLAGISAGLMLFVLLGSDPASDVMAHAGGFVTGLSLERSWCDLR